MNTERKTRSSEKKRKILTVILAVVMFLLGGVGGFFINRLTKSETSRTIEQIVGLIDKVGYVYDEQTFEKRELSTEEIADAIANSLDDYATYYTPEEYSALKRTKQGNYTDFGIGFYDEDLQIDVCYYNSPAFYAGVRKDDVIVGGRLSLEVENTLFNDVYDLLDHFRSSKQGQTVYLTVARKGEFTNKEFALSLNAYQSVYVSYNDFESSVYFTEKDGDRTKTESAPRFSTLPSDTVYIDFIAFEGRASEQLQTALDIMKEKGKTRLILDLRDNGGGQMTILSEVVSSLVYCGGRSNLPMVYEEHKNKTEVAYSGKNKGNSFIEKIVVLADGFTASASEALIGAMTYYCGEVFSLDNLIVEKNASNEARTYGKGIMQTTYTLTTGGAFTLTTAKLLWPDQKTCIHGVGVRPTNSQNAVEKTTAVERAIEFLS